MDLLRKVSPFIILIAIHTWGSTDAMPVRLQSEIEVMIWKNVKAVNTCPMHQFFNHDLKECKDCQIFCIDNTGEPTCKRQCSVFFYANEVERKLEKQAEKISSLEQDVENFRAEGASKNKVPDWLSIAAAICCFICLVIAVVVVVIKLVKRYGKKCVSENIHRQQIPELQPLSNGSANQREESQPRPQKVFNTNTRSNRGDKAYAPDSDQQEEIGFASGQPAEK